TSVPPSVATAATLSEIPGGQVPLDSLFYIQRPPIEQRCYDTIKQPGSLIRIQAPRQMGKTSLMARILEDSRQEGYLTVALNLQLASQNVFSNLERFLQWFCVIVGKNLGLPNQLAEYWDDILDSNSSTTDYFENYLLPHIHTPLVIALDDVDVLFRYPDLASDFLGLLRSWYEKARYGDTTTAIWKKLRLLVVHSTEIILSLTIEQSPFNVGLLIELPEFNSSQVQDLVQRHGLDWDSERIEQLMNLVGGNPYLIRKALFHIHHQEVTLEELLPKSATKGRVYGEHLRRKLARLQDYPELLTALIQVTNSPIPVELEPMQALKLHGMGLVQLRGKQVIPRCELYRQYFRQEAITYQPSVNTAFGN
ncbi:MAG TPA: family 3 adenylate cyclase, partial [Cyanobacteria bacterium UBA11370]|nr:family 3 adenylate cyclase [Cyanobacteria bacterium UBA11370]